jgi:hypothetical protein
MSGGVVLALLAAPFICWAGEPGPMAEMLKRVEPAVDTLKALTDEASPQAVAAAEQALTKLCESTEALVNKREKATCIAVVHKTLTDGGRLEKAIAAYAKYGPLNAGGMISIGIGRRADVRLAFAMQNILLKYGRRELVMKMVRLRPDEMHAVFGNLLSGKTPRYPTEVEVELRALLQEASAANAPARKQRDKELDEVIDLLCSLGKNWRATAPGKELPSLVKLSRLLCRARLAQARTKDALTEYKAHAVLLYKSLPPKAASEQLVTEAAALKAVPQVPVARKVFLLVRGDPAKDATTYLARIEAAVCLKSLPFGAYQLMLNEAADVFRDDVSDKRLAVLLLSVAVTAAPRDAAFALRIVKTISADLSETDKPSALRITCNCLARQGDAAGALATFKVLRRDYPKHAVTASAERALRKAGIILDPPEEEPAE